MALTSTTDSLSTIPRTATPKTESFVRAHAVWLAALAVWFLNDFEVPVSGRHLVAISAGVGLLLGILFASVLILVIGR